MSEETKKAPPLRFKGFSDAWEQRKLGENVIIKSGWSPSNFVRTNSEGSELFIKVDDLNYSSREQNDSQMRVHDNPRFQKMKKGSIIFPKRGAAIMTNKVRILGSDGYMDTNMMALDPQGIDAHFLYTFIARTGLYKIADTSTIPQINNKHIEPYIVYCPSIEEQIKVGSFFKKLDDTIALHQRNVALLKRQKEAYLKRMLPQNSENKPLLRFADFSDPWDQRTLGELSEIVRGASPRPIQDPKWFDSNSNVGWLRISDVTEQNGRITHLEQKISKAGQEKTRVLFEPHLLLSIAATVGKPVVNYVNTGVHDGFLIFLNPIFDREYMFQWLEMFRPKWQKYGQPGSQVNLNSELVRNQEIMIPAIREQIIIGSFLKKLDDTTALHQIKLDKLTDLKQVLLAKMFV
nr:restriction endonuclease subunit S [uncultured Trichococcus sp.]